MQKIKENYKLNNQGFTLIEMVVTVAIIAIFAGVVLSFITTGSNLFRNTSNTAKVQMETQETFDKIEDMIINSNRKLSYGESSHIFEVASFDEQVAAKSGGIATASLRSVNSGTGSTAENTENVRDYIIWNESTEEITYIHAENSDGTWRNSNTSSANPRGDVLATGVTYFQADVSKAVSDNIVNFVLKTKKGTKEIETTHSVSLRNNLQFDYIPDEPFDNPTIEPVTPGPNTPTPEPNKTKPISLRPDKNKILIAAGANYDLGSNITWKVLYSDASTTSTGNLSWSVNCNYASVSSLGVLAIDPDAGTADKGTVTVTVTDTEHENVYGTLEVSIARIDLIIPNKNAIYKVGNEKQLQYTYLEGGRAPSDAGTAATVTTEQKPDTASNYSDSGNFTQNDVGNWKVKVSVDLVSRTGYDITYGTVEDENEFSVSDPTKDIVILTDPSIDTIIAGRTYGCSPTITHGINWIPVPEKLWNANAKMKWDIKGNTEGISIDSNDYAPPSTERHIKVESDVRHGFTICADFVMTNEDGTKIEAHAEREIKVANGIEVTSMDGDTVYAYKNGNELQSDEFRLQVLLNVYGPNEEETKLRVSNKNGTIIYWKNLNNSKVTESSDGKNWNLMINEGNVGTTFEILAHLQEVSGVFDPESNYSFTDTVSINVKEPEVKLAINGADTVYFGDTKQYWLKAIVNGIEKTDFDVTWKWQKSSTWSEDLGKTKSDKDSLINVEFSSGDIYELAAEVKLGEKTYTISKNISVKEPEVKLTINGADTAYLGDTKQYWLKAMVNGIEKTDFDVTWRWQRNSQWTIELGKTKSVADSLIDVEFSSGDVYELVADVKLGEKTYTISKSISVKEPEVKLTLNGTDTAYLGDTRQYWLKVMVNGVEKTDFDVTWRGQWTIELGKTKSAADSPINVEFSSGGTYKLDAEVKVGGKTYTVSKNISVSVMAEIIVVDGKTSLHSGERTQLYLRLSDKTRILDASANWKVSDNQLISFSSSWQQNICNNGDVIPITVQASSNVTKVQNVTITVEWHLATDWNVTGIQTINLTITP